jgi:hypothetical protein
MEAGERVREVREEILTHAAQKNLNPGTASVDDHEPAGATSPPAGAG